MSSGEARRLCSQDLQTVQNLIERCIQLHMNRIDAVNVLLREAKIQPSITELVWQRLEEENPEFFEAYHIRLALNDQIKLFNELLKQQAALMEQMQSSGAVSMPASNGCHINQFQQNAGCYAIDQTRCSTRPQSLRATMSPTLPPFTNGAPTLHTPTTFNVSSTRSNDFPPNSLHVHSSNSMRIMQELNGEIPKKESGYLSDSRLMFDADANNVVGAHASIENATFSHFDVTLRPLNEALLGVEATAFGQLEQLPKNFSFPDLAAYPNLDLLESFSDADDFLGSQDRGETTEHKLESISENYRIEGFGGRE